MKLLSLVAGALALGSSLALPTVNEHIVQRELVGRGRGSKGDRTRPDAINPIARPKKLDPEYRDVSRIMGEAPHYPKPWNPKIPSGEPVRRGMTGFQHSPDHKIVVHYYGDAMPFHGSHQKYYEAAYPETKGMGYHVRKTGGSLRDFTLGGLQTIPHADRDENPPQSWLYFKGGFTVMAVPHQESKFQSAMMRQGAAECPDCVHVAVDNRSPDTMHIEGTPMRGPAGVSGYSDPRSVIPRQPVGSTSQYMSPAEIPVYQGPARNPDRVPGSNPSTRQAYPVTYAPNYNNQMRDDPKYRNAYYQRRSIPEASVFERDIIGDIEGQQAGANDTSQVEDSQAIVEYLWAYDQYQTNATIILQPFIEAIMNASSNYLVEMQAWALYSMISPGVSMMGPFMNNMDAFDDLATWTAGNNSLTPESTNDLKEWTANLGAFNTFVYNKAADAVNETGILGQLDTLNQWLISVDQTLLPEEETTVDPHAVEPFMTFLEQMYAYNGFAFTAADTGNGTANNTLPDWIWSTNSTAASNATLTNTTSVVRPTGSAFSAPTLPKRREVKLF